MTLPFHNLKKTLPAQMLYQIVLMIVYGWCFSRVFPDAQGVIGPDYQYFFPHLLDGFFWFLENGLLAVPWFSPGFCGGLPAFANPQNLYYSVPQLLTFAFGPLSGVYLTVLLFAWLGYLGMYFLTRSVFAVRPLVATLAATLFCLNGFYFSHLAIGHLSFHAFMVTPLLCNFLLKPLRQDNRLQAAAGHLFYGIAGGLLWAYMFYAGMLVLLIQVMACVIAVACLYGLMQTNLKSFTGRFVLSGIIGLLISLPRFLAVSAFVSHFPRSSYEIPGSTFLESISLFFRSLFLPATWSFAPELISHVQWNPQLHEYDFSITPVPLLILVAGVIYLIMKHKGKLLSALSSAGWAYAALLAFLLALPFALNLYSPGWHEILKSVPVIKTASTMIRWYIIDLVIMILLSALFMDRLDLFKKYPFPLAATGIAVAILLFAMQPVDYYTSEHYDPSDIIKSYSEHRSENIHPQVQHVVMFTDESGQHVVTSHDNDVLAMKSSQLYCYEPIFGYHLEQFPRKTLQPGSIFSPSGGFLNLKNPACYIFPEDNACQPGDHFSVYQKEEMERFASYRPYPFLMPLKQKLAGGISLITLSAALLFLLAYCGAYLYAALRKPSNVTKAALKK